ncbi:hypothetical protein ACIPJS_04685 [Streptomyces sp. NPDC086783]|uniref:hypothetical protein n=1 Tax=Streptomyces sp. NPDC086783 TaxID=3365758 RepID=UPI0037FD323A
MPRPSRRALLAGATGLAAASLLPSPAASATPSRMRLTREEHRVVVIERAMDAITAHDIDTFI